MILKLSGRMVITIDIKNPHQPKPEKQHSSAELLDLLHNSFIKGDDLLAQLRKELVK